MLIFSAIWYKLQFLLKMDINSVYLFINQDF